MLVNLLHMTKYAFVGLVEIVSIILVMMAIGTTFERILGIKLSNGMTYLLEMVGLSMIIVAFFLLCWMIGTF